MPLSVNECNLREAHTIAPTEVRQRGNVYVRGKPRYRKRVIGYISHTGSRLKCGLLRCHFTVCHAKCILTRSNVYLRYRRPPRVYSGFHGLVQRH
jgi:hypothetical protein